MPRQKIPPLDWQTPIVDPKTGVPSPQFIRLWQLLFQNEAGTNDTAEDALEGLDSKADKTTQIIAGVGLSGGGDLSADRTINLDASIDDLTDVDTSSTPPTDGQALVWVDADSEWAPGDVASGSNPFKGARVKKAADQTGANYTAGAAIAFDAEDYDTDGFHDTVTNNTRLTVPSGVTRVQVTGQVRLNNITAGSVPGVWIRLNGGTLFAGQANHNPATIWDGNVSSGVINVSTGDYFELFLQNNTDTSIDIIATRTFFSIEAVEETISRSTTFSGAKVRKSADLTGQNLSAGADVTWNSEDWDTDGFHDNVSNTQKLSPSVGGKYRCTGQLTLANVATGNYMEAHISRYNSSDVLQEVVARQGLGVNLTGTHHVNMTGTSEFSVGDYLKMVASCTDTSTDISTRAYLEIYRLEQ